MLKCFFLIYFHNQPKVKGAFQRGAKVFLKRSCYYFMFSFRITIGYGHLECMSISMIIYAYFLR